MAFAPLIEIVDYDAAWPEAFVEEAERLAHVLGPELVEIHHIGSTSIQFMPAKPVIDLLPVVRDIEQVDFYNDAMAEMGYIAKGEYGLEGRRYFTRDVNGVRTHNVHIWQANHQAIARHIDFRDFLKAHGEEALEYAELKHKLASRFPRDLQSYNDGKSAFIRRIEARAKAWRHAQRRRRP